MNANKMLQYAKKILGTDEVFDVGVGLASNVSVEDVLTNASLCQLVDHDKDCLALSQDKNWVKENFDKTAVASLLNKVFLRGYLYKSINGYMFVIGLPLRLISEMNYYNIDTSKLLVWEMPAYLFQVFSAEQIRKASGTGSIKKFMYGLLKFAVFVGICLILKYVFSLVF